MGMPENELRVIDIPTGLRPVLTAREKGDLEKAERKIATGLKSFLEVGLALKQIRDKRLYRQQFDTFEEYVAKRWEMSRPRAYELCAASEVMSDLSGIPDIRVLPENEAQANPLTRLKTPRHRQKAWLMALKLAKAGGRPVTASNVEAAVLKLDGEARSSPVDGVPVFDPSQGIADALAALEEGVESLAHDQPDRIAALRSEIGKLRSDILQLEQHRRLLVKPGNGGEPSFPIDERFWLGCVVWNSQPWTNGESCKGSSTRGSSASLFARFRTTAPRGSTFFSKPALGISGWTPTTMLW
jgi:hypothetical protein